MSKKELNKITVILYRLLKHCTQQLGKFFSFAQNANTMHENH